jgi:hypothetical protein
MREGVTEMSEQDWLEPLVIAAEAADRNCVKVTILMPGAASGRHIREKMLHTSAAPSTLVSSLR